MSEGLGAILSGDEPAVLEDAPELARFTALGTDKTANSDFNDDNSE